jgi:uncharacterized membrane protein YjjB (DUF3815 family)
MNFPFDAIARRRAVLVEEIGFERARVAVTLQTLHKQMAIASLGLMVSQFAGRSRWLRIAALAAVAVSIGGRMLARLLPARR